MKVACSACRIVLEFPERVGFRDTCPSCDAYLHSCVNCDFRVNSRCTEPSAEKVRDPEGINFCDWYQARDKRQGIRDKEEGSKEAAEEMWKRLTKK